MAPSKGLAREGYEAPDGYGEEREGDEKREEEEVLLVTAEIKPSPADNDGLDNHCPPPRPATPPSASTTLAEPSLSPTCRDQVPHRR